MSTAVKQVSLGLAVGLFVICVRAFAAEPAAVPVSRICLEGTRGESLVAEVSERKLEKLELRDSSGLWDVPRQALELEFLYSLSETKFMFDSGSVPGAKGYLVIVPGTRPTAQGSRFSKVVFKFYGHSLRYREVWDTSNEEGILISRIDF